MKRQTNSTINNKRTLASWLFHAEKFLNGAKVLGNPSIDVKYKTGLSSWFLLHLAIESYLKAVILNEGQKIPKTHDLVELSDQIKDIDNSIKSELEKEVGGRSIELWIKFINPFGYPDGGIRYTYTNSSMFAAPVGISNFFDNLIKSIDDYCDKQKDITNLI